MADLVETQATRPPSFDSIFISNSSDSESINTAASAVGNRVSHGFAALGAFEIKLKVLPPVRKGRYV